MVWIWYLHIALIPASWKLEANSLLCSIAGLRLRQISDWYVLVGSPPHMGICTLVNLKSAI
jgi:hypothetical protein